MSTDWEPSCSIDTLRQRAVLLSKIRTFFAELGVLEVQTSCVAKHTVTDPNIHSIKIPKIGYLQTSPEYQLKRLLAAGAPSIYQMGPVFRAEEIGPQHALEFTMLEWYRLNYDHRQLMDEVAELVDRMLGPADYRYVTYAEVLDHSNAISNDIDLKFLSGLTNLGMGRIFVTDYPIEQAALAQLDGDPPLASRFELIIDGVEIANGYHELGEINELDTRFEKELQIRKALNLERYDLDAEFMAAMKHGLPPCSGVALGVDRLLMILLGATSIAEVNAFPIEPEIINV
ncbi:MAG: hypothetical protein CMD74_04180 [Gammaproteobacteria bacterium]|nr:hypothetical protein [Gammaproteobacteria bacterium]|tara:strand:+ start:1711 stop:2571 length:861 start_codon:yes stop_codon:yes gene_type:complete